MRALRSPSKLQYLCSTSVGCSRVRFIIYWRVHDGQSPCSRAHEIAAGGQLNATNSRPAGAFSMTSSSRGRPRQRRCARSGSLRPESLPSPKKQATSGLKQLAVCWRHGRGRGSGRSPCRSPTSRTRTWLAPSASARAPAPRRPLASAPSRGARRGPRRRVRSESRKRCRLRLRLDTHCVPVSTQLQPRL